MRLMRLLPIAVVLIILSCGFAQNENLVLKPHELVDLIRRDLAISDAPDHIHDLKLPASERSSTAGIMNQSALEKRKVWSRWSKWGECSVSCGRGYITRKRVCVAGRCAPGELEEQRRLCSRNPCSPTTLHNHYDDVIE